MGALKSAVNLGNFGSEAAPHRGLLRLQEEGHNRESKTRLFFPPESRPLRPARGRLSQSQTLWAQDPPSRKAPHRQHWTTPPDNCLGPRPHAPSLARDNKLEIPSPAPETTPLLPQHPPIRAPPPGRSPAQAQPSTWCRGAEVHHAPQRPPAPARRWGGLGVGVEAGASAGLGRPGDSRD